MIQKFWFKNYQQFFFEMWDELFGYDSVAIKEKNYEQLVNWYHKDYIPNCWMSHICQNCNPSQEFENLKNKPLVQQCQHGIQFMEDSLRDLEIYKYIPKRMIQYQCNTCQYDYHSIDDKQCHQLRGILTSYGLWLFNQDKRTFCLFRHLNEQIILNAFKLDKKTQKKVLSLVKLWKFKQHEIQHALLFEKYFFQYINVSNLNNDDNHGYKLDIICQYNQYVEIEPYFIDQATLSENYLAYIIEYKYLYVYDIQKDNIILIKTFKNKIITHCLFSEDGKYLYITFSDAITVVLDVKINFQPAKRWFFCEEHAQTTEISNLKHNQIIVAIQKHYGKTNKYIHQDVRRNKLIVVYRKLSKHNIDQRSLDDKNNCILLVTDHCLMVYSGINRSIIYNVEMNNIRYINAFGGNHVLELDDKYQMNLLTFKYETLCLERQLIQVNVESFYSTKFEQYCYKLRGQAKKWNLVSQIRRSIYSVEQTKYHNLFSKFNIELGNIFLINDAEGISISNKGMRLLIMN